MLRGNQFRQGVVVHHLQDEVIQGHLTEMSIAKGIESQVVVIWITKHEQLSFFLEVCEAIQELPEIVSQGI